MHRNINRRQFFGILALVSAALVFVLAIGSLIGLRAIEEQQSAASRVTRIVHEMNGYRVYWAGSAALSDIAAYDVQVCELPCAGWRDWQMGVSETSAWFGPDEGKHFAFRVRAHDRAGHAEPWPAQASMTTRQARDG